MNILEKINNYFVKTNLTDFRKSLAYSQSISGIFASTVIILISILFCANLESIGTGPEYVRNGLLLYVPVIIIGTFCLLLTIVFRKLSSHKNSWRILEACTYTILTVLPFWAVFAVYFNIIPNVSANLLIWATTIIGFCGGFITAPLYSLIVIASNLAFLFIRCGGLFHSEEYINTSLMAVICIWISISRFSVTYENFRRELEKQSYLARITHEIRTPINTVIGTNELIQRENPDEKIYNYSKDISNSCEMLKSLVNDILDLSKLESGKMKIVEDEYSLSKMLAEIDSMIRYRATSCGLNFVTLINDELPDTLYGDEIRIKQIIMNLLTNAVKYTDHGTVGLVVEGAVSQDTVTMIFRITDTGVGISEEDIEKLQQGFYRIESKRNHRIEGTGLGLNIVAILLDAMGGKLKVNSEVNVGSEFIATLPQKITDHTSIKALREAQKKSSSGASAGRSKYKPSFEAPYAKILVVDDNEINLKLFCKLLEYTKVQATPASSGEEMLELVQNEHFDIIFLDHMMPGMDGCETLSRMSKTSHLCDGTPIIALTANERSDGAEYYKSFGFTDYLSKPVDVIKLETMVKDYLPESLVTQINS